MRNNIDSGKFSWMMSAGADIDGRRLFDRANQFYDDYSSMICMSAIKSIVRLALGSTMTK